MASYKERVAEDLDRWIAAGDVAADRREAILNSIPDARRLDAGAALAAVGAVLLGIAVITFVAANWDAIPRLVRFIMILALYAAAVGAGAWAGFKGKPGIANGLLTFASLVFAAAIGLTGQIFDLAGDPRTAMYAAGLAAAALGLAGRASGPWVAALIFFGAGDFQDGGLFRSEQTVSLPWLALGAPLAAAFAIIWRSWPLAHAGAVGLMAAFLWIAMRLENPAGVMLIFSFGLGLLAARGRWRAENGQRLGQVFYGWFAWGMLGFFVFAGYAYNGESLDIPHRLAWLALAGGLVAAGRHDRHALVTAAGVIGLLGAVAAILSDLGLNLMAAAGIFAAMALAALGIALFLRRRRRP